MARLVDVYCPHCDTIYEDVWSDAHPLCCGAETRWKPTVPHTTEWGGPRTYLHLRDEPFSSRSELESWTHAQGMVPSESNEKVGGARNEEYIHGRRLYSHPK